MNLIEWIKNNKLAFALILIVLYFVFFGNRTHIPGFKMLNRGEMETFSYGTAAPMMDSVGMGGGPIEMMGRMKAMPANDVYYEESVSPSAARMVVTDNYFSLQVADVPASIAGINSTVAALGGFMVSSNVSKPEESASGSITIRVPADKSDAMIKYLKDNSIKVVSENIQGTDITDQYKDVESRLATLTKNKARFEVLMDEANTVDEILKVQSQLFMLQDQIDSLIGQRDYLKDTAESVKITVYLSTDEYALPYVPDTSWRPEAIFKEAVRSLVMDFRSLGNKLIWLAVYAVIWVPIILISFVVYKNWKAKKASSSIKKKA